ncbi:MAG: aspartate aminotransferase family protein [Solirubrobacteraceae bacterium]
MNPSHDALQRDARDHLLLHFSRNGNLKPLLVLERGDGPYVYDTLGRRHIDALSSLFCSQLGYSYGSEMAEAASAQMKRLAFNTNWSTAHPAAIELAGKLADIAPGDLDHVFFTNGGSESVEAAWKLVRQYHLARGESGRTKAIARRNAYHGVTLGALSFTGVEPMKVPFGRPPIDVTHVSDTNRFRAEDGDDELAFCTRLLEELEDAIIAEGPQTVAMIIAEPVQNAGGCLTPPAGYWPGLREIADRHGILLVADEVICGFGRLGAWFGSERYDAQPDLVTVAKGITSAYAPMGAVIVADHVAAPFYEDDRLLAHGITFGGHPVSAAVALKTLEIFRRDRVLENVQGLEEHLWRRLEELRALPIVGDIRGAGFFWAVELVKDAEGTRLDADERERLLRGYLPARLLEAGLIARADDRGDAVLQIAPPLISDAALLDDIVDGMAEVLTDAGTFIGAGASAAAGTAA